MQMSFLGKILVVFQLVASIIFMIFAAGVYQSHVKWRDAYNTQKGLTTKAQAELNTEKGAHEKTKRDFEQQVLAANTVAQETQAKLTLAEQERDAAKTREAQRLQELAANQEQATIAAEESTARRDEALLLRELNKQLLESRNLLATDLGKTQDQLKSTEINLEAAVAKNSELIRQNAQMVQALGRHRISVDDLADAAAPTPRVRGEVVSIQATRSSGGAEMVEISLGADDLLRKGHRLTVYRAADAAGGTPKYLGKIEIIRTMPDRAVAIVVERAGNGTLKAGDKVTTSL
jgi:hypothetical protein